MPRWGSPPLFAMGLVPLLPMWLSQVKPKLAISYWPRLPRSPHKLAWSPALSACGLARRAQPANVFINSVALGARATCWPPPAGRSPATTATPVPSTAVWPV